MCTYPDITITQNFVADHQSLFSQLVGRVCWAQATRGRKTASFGVPFGESPDGDTRPFAPELRAVADRIREHLGWTPNTCALDYYPQRRSNKGMDAPPDEGLDPSSAIAVLSVGATRVMVFERDDGHDVYGRELAPGSLLVMSLASQRGWRHAVPARSGVGPQISVTFRRVAVRPAPARLATCA